MTQSYSARQIAELRQTWPTPSAPHSIISIGCGGIVHDGHPPAYTKAAYSLPVCSISIRKRRRRMFKNSASIGFMPVWPKLLPNKA